MKKGWLEYEIRLDGRIAFNIDVMLYEIWVLCQFYVVLTASSQSFS